MMNAHHELNMKDMEISTLKMHNDQLQNELERENDQKMEVFKLGKIIDN